VTETTTIDPPPLNERIFRFSAEIAMLLAVAFIAFRIYSSTIDGGQMADRERRALEVLRAVHGAQRDAIAAGSPRFLWLSELREKSPAGSPLDRLTVHAAVPSPKVDVFRVRGYLVALFLNDPVREDGRAYATAAAESPEVGATGFGAFAWPEEYHEGTQWAFYVDQRGILLGSWNHKRAFDGFEAPFPSPSNPLKDYLEGKRNGDDSEWFAFDEVLGEIETPAAKAARAPGKQ
jgi:hypothetical protein